MTTKLSPDRQTRILLVVLTIVGFLLRIHCLGCLGFRWDEDLTSLAVKALLDSGVPELPSGMIYLRFYLYQWILAVSASIFGISEFSLRLPGVLFSTAMIPLIYWISSSLFDRRVGIIAAAAMAVSFDQVEMARTARMYAPFFVVYMLAAYSIYRIYFLDKERLFSVWPLLLAFLALSLHQLAYSLAAIFLLAILLNPTPKRILSLFLQAGLVGVGFLAIKSMVEHYFYRGERLLSQGGVLGSGSENSGGLLESVLNQVALPNIDLFMQVAYAAPLLIALVVALAIALCAWSLRATTRGTAGERIFFIAIILCCLFHQFNLAILLFALLIVASGGGVRTLASTAVVRLFVGVFVLFVTWIGIAFVALGYLSAEVPIAELGIRKLIRALVDYPNFRLFWSYVLERPLLAVPLGLGTLWALDRISGAQKDERALFLAGTFWIALFLNGILKTKYEFFRYNLHLDFLYLILVVIGVLELPRLAGRWNAGLGAKFDSWLSGSRLVGLTLVLVILAVNPLAAALTSHRDYQEDGLLYRAFGLDRYQDFATPGNYVKERLRQEDRVFVTEPREYWNYIGRVDFWIASDKFQSQTFEYNNTAYDLYLGIPVIQSRRQLLEALQLPAAGDVWLLYSRSMLARTPWISNPIKELLDELSEYTVYVGRDGQTLVIRIPPDASIRQ